MLDRRRLERRHAPVGTDAIAVVQWGVYASFATVVGDRAPAALDSAEVVDNVEGVVQAP